MTEPQYQGVVPCWDQSRYALYDNACRAYNFLGQSDQWTDVTFACFGISMATFANNLANAGENVCVCSYQNQGNNNWAFYRSFGPCDNDICTAVSFSCDGSTPINTSDNSGGQDNIQATGGVVSQAATASNTAGAATSSSSGSTTGNVATSSANHSLTRAMTKSAIVIVGVLLGAITL